MEAAEPGEQVNKSHSVSLYPGEFLTRAYLLTRPLLSAPLAVRGCAGAAKRKSAQKYFVTAIQ
jgi:hypothetical protein